MQSKIEAAKAEADSWKARTDELLERKQRVLSRCFPPPPLVLYASIPCATLARTHTLVCRFSGPVLTRMLDDQAAKAEADAESIVSVCPVTVPSHSFRFP